MKQSFLLLLFINLAAIAYPQDYKVYTKDNISFNYPSNWIARDFPQYYILISEPPKDQLSVMTTFNVEITDTIQSLKKFCKIYEEQLKNNTVFQKTEIIFKINFNYNGYEAIQYSCNAMVQNMSMEWETVIFVKDKKVYKLSMTSSIGKLDEIREKTKIIWNSFTFK